MQNRKLIKNYLWLLSILLVCVFVFAGCKTIPTTTIVPPEETYAYNNPTKTLAEPDAGFVIDGVLDEPQYQNCNWLKLQNNQGGAGVDIAMTSYYGEKGIYIIYDVAENSMIYVNPDRPTYLNSCIEMYFASSNATSMSSNEVFEIDMLPTGELSVRQRTGKDNWVNVATTDDIMARLGATTKGGPVNTEACKGYNLELFIPWEYLDYVGLSADQMKQSYVYINPTHITSYNYEGTESGTDRYWYSFATQLGSDGWNDVAQFFRFGKDGAIGTAAVELEQGAHYTITGNDSVIPGVLTTVQIIPENGYALTSILVNGEEQIQKVAYNQDGSVTLSLRGEKDGLKISANAEAAADGKKTLSGTVQVNKLGGDTLEGVSLSYKGPSGEKPVTFDENGNFELTDLTPGYYVISAMKQGYRSVNRGIYLNRDVKTDLVLEYEMFQAESGYNWILDAQNDGVLNRFGGSGKILSAASYDKFAVEANFRYDTELAEMSDGDTFLQQRSGIQIKFSNGKYWRVDLMKENGVYKVQYAKHNESTLFSWKTVHTLTEAEIAKYQSEAGIKLSILRDGQVAWVCLDGKPVAIEVLDSEYSNLKARIGFEGWIANQEIESMEYDIREDFKQNLWGFYFTTNTQWDISRQLQGSVTLPDGGTAALPFYHQYRDADVVLYNVKEHDRTGKKPGRTDLLMEFDTNGNGPIDKSVSFGIVCTNPATKTCWIQTLGNADNYIATTRVKGLYKLNAQQAEKYLNGGGVELEVIRKGTNVYVFLDGEEVAIWDLTQNNSGVKATTPAKLSIRHYDAKGKDVRVTFKISGTVNEVEIDKIFKDNEKWDLSKQYEGVVSLPGGGTDTSLQLFEKYQNIDFTVLAKENDATGKKFGRTDILFEFDLNNDGAMDKNVSFGVVQLTGGRCVVQTLGWADKHIPATRINELYELDYAETLKYKGEGINLRVVRYGTNAYVYLEDKQVAVFDLTQNNSGVTADSPATVSLRHYDAVADAVTIPFTVTDQVTEPAIVPLPTSVFKPNYKWDLSKQNEGIVTLPGGGTNAVVFYDSFTDIDLTITAKENKAATAPNGGRTDILFEFDLDNNGTMDKSVSFGIVKWSATSNCIVETLGNSNNHIPATRKNTLYTLNATETEAYLDDGVELRVVRMGTDVYVFVEGKAVAVFDLTQNNSGVTADMKATVSLRHYDAVADQVVIPFAVTAKLPNVTITDNSVNGTVTAGGSCQIGDTVTLTGAAKDGYYLVGLKVDGAAVTLNADGTYSFTATKLSYTVEGIFREKLFVDNAKWDLSQQNLGTIVADGVEKTQGVATLLGGGSNAVAFRDQYTDMDITVTAKEYDTTGKKPGRIDVLFEFANGKNVSFGATCTKPAEKTCWVQTLGISTNHIPATRINGLYNLSAAEAEKYLSGDGIALRLIRKGTNVYVFLEGNAVAVFDLTQNNSGVTADMKAKVSLRHYDAAADRVDIPFTITTQLLGVTITDNSVNGTVTAGGSCQIGDTVTLTGAAKDGYYLVGLKVDGAAVTLNADGTYSFTATKLSYTVEGIFREKLFVDNAKWDLSQQNLGTIVADGVEKTQGVATLLGGGSNAVAFRDQYTDMDITVTAKEYDTTGKKPGRIDVLFEFANGKNVSFGVTCTKPAEKTCWVQTLGISTNHIPATRINGLYNLSAAEAEKYLSGDGIALRVIRKGTNVLVLVEGNVVYTFDLTQNNSGVTADMKAKVSLRHYDAAATKVDIPFAITNQAQEPVVSGAGYVPVKAQQVATSGSFSAFPRTIEITFNRNSLTSRAILFGNCDGKTLDYFNLERPANEDILYLNMCLNGVKYEHSFHLFHIPAGETLRVTVVFEDEAIKLYVNGSLAQTRTTSNGGNGSKTMGALWESAAKAKLPATWGIGDDLRKNYCFTGTIYDIAVWGDARTADEIADSSIAKLGTADYQDNLLVAYDFQATYKVTAVNPFHQDLSGNGNHLTGTLNVQTR